MTMTTHKFEDNDLTYYTTSDNKIYFHRDNAEKHEKYLHETEIEKRFYTTFGYQNVTYHYIKQWLNDNQQLVKDMTYTYEETK